MKIYHCTQIHTNLLGAVDIEYSEIYNDSTT